MIYTLWALMFVLCICLFFVGMALVLKMIALQICVLLTVGICVSAWITALAIDEKEQEL